MKSEEKLTRPFNLLCTSLNISLLSGCLLYLPLYWAIIKSVISPGMETLDNA